MKNSKEFLSIVKALSYHHFCLQMKNFDPFIDQTGLGYKIEGDNLVIKACIRYMGLPYECAQTIYAIPDDIEQQIAFVKHALKTFRNEFINLLTETPGKTCDYCGMYYVSHNSECPVCIPSIEIS